MPDPEHPLLVTWVQSDRLPDGSYGITVSVGDDVSWPLTAKAAFRYASALVEASVHAEHDAAVSASLAAKGIGNDEMLGHIIGQMRADRGEVIKAGPLTLVPGVSMFDGRPFLEVRPPRGEKWMWSPGSARNHALNVFGVAAAVADDNRLRKILLRDGLEPELVAAMIGTLPEHWPADEIHQGGGQ